MVVAVAAEGHLWRASREHVDDFAVWDFELINLGGVEVKQETHS
jgi:hypothetical protein